MSTLALEQSAAGLPFAGLVDSTSGASVDALGVTMRKDHSTRFIDDVFLPVPADEFAFAFDLAMAAA